MPKPDMKDGATGGCIKAWSSHDCQCPPRLHCDNPHRHKACETCAMCLSGNPATCLGPAPLPVVEFECHTLTGWHGTVMTLTPLQAKVHKDSGHDIRPAGGKP